MQETPMNFSSVCKNPQSIFKLNKEPPMDFLFYARKFFRPVDP